MGELRLRIRQAQHINVGLVVNRRSGFWKDRIVPAKDRWGFSGTV